MSNAMDDPGWVVMALFEQDLTWFKATTNDAFRHRMNSHVDVFEDRRFPAYCILVCVVILKTGREFLVEVITVIVKECMCAPPKERFEISPPI